MPTVLEKIIARKKSEIENLDQKYKDKTPEISKKNFLKSFKKNTSDSPNLMAEIKKKSPSMGEIWPEAPITEIAECYEKNGAASLSCLTDNYFFGGSLDDLKKVSEIVKIPVLRKDFILEKSQILESRIFGADAVLLMVSVILETKKLRILREYAESLGMSALIETHNAEEIKIAVDAEAKIIGVNSRNFADLSIDLDNFERTFSLIPPGIVRVAESGLKNFEIVKKISPFCDAILVGTYFMETQNLEKMAELVKQFSGK